MKDLKAFPTMRDFVAKWYRHMGLSVVVGIYIFSYLTAKDPFWSGKATFFAMFVLLGIAIFDMVIKNGMEKS
ncbi:MAG: hypothetical protein GOU98_04825 [Candidatus Altiarchaeota archaeon]|nr:hypothetical protein [Candidatus Altiarchaeota archaeon]